MWSPQTKSPKEVEEALQSRGIDLNKKYYGIVEYFYLSDFRESRGRIRACVKDGHIGKYPFKIFDVYDSGIEKSYKTVNGSKVLEENDLVQFSPSYTSFGLTAINVKVICKVQNERAFLEIVSEMENEKKQFNCSVKHEPHVADYSQKEHWWSNIFQDPLPKIIRPSKKEKANE